jgi:TonB family protein
METLAPPEFASPETEPELHLLLARDAADDHRRWKAAVIGTAVWHVVLVTGLLLAPEGTNKVYQQAPVVTVTHLVTPPDILTQKDPNKGKLSKELSIEAIAPHSPVRTPAPPAAVKQTPKPAPPPAPQIAKAEPKPVLVEPPKIDLPKLDAPKIQLDVPPIDQSSTTNGPPASTQPPKLAMENVPPPGSPSRGAANGRQLGTILIPNPSVDSAIHELSRSGVAPGGQQSVTDFGNDLGNSGLNLPPSAGRPKSNLELRSDPMGVDFRPYMIQVLAAVRRNWFAVYPEAARRGQRGEVALEFAVAKQGSVVKVVYSTESGAKALDQAAVAAISASNPLPPLPSAFKGERIVLRLTFQYNMPR